MAAPAVAKFQSNAFHILAQPVEVPRGNSFRVATELHKIGMEKSSQVAGIASALIAGAYDTVAQVLTMLARERGLLTAEEALASKEAATLWSNIFLPKVHV